MSVSPADLVATVQAGTPLEALRRRLAEEGMWLAIDPPGRPERSLGSVVATGTSGPLRHGFGPVRDHVLGCTVATGDGRLVRAGGRVVKNVAGYDLTKLQVGGFGGFGIIAEVHLRLRALPRADVTVIARGPRDTLTSAARDLIAAQLLPGTLELLSPALAAEPDWTLAARFAGHRRGGAGRRAPAEHAAASWSWQPLPADRTAAFWSLVARGSLGGPITLRLGVLGDGVDETIDLLAHDLDEGLVSAGAGAGHDPLDRRRAGGAAARGAPRRRRARDPHDPRARPLAGAPRPGPLRRLPRGRRASSSAGCATASIPGTR